MFVIFVNKKECFAVVRLPKKVFPGIITIQTLKISFTVLLKNMLTNVCLLLFLITTNKSAAF